MPSKQRSIYLAYCEEWKHTRIKGYNQDWLNNSGPVENKNVGLLIQKLSRIWRQKWQSTETSARPFWAGALCIGVAHLLIKLPWHRELCHEWCVSVCSGCHLEVPWLCTLNNEKDVLPVLGVGGPSSPVFWGLSRWLVDGHLLPVSSRSLPSMCSHLTRTPVRTD